MLDQADFCAFVLGGGSWLLGQWITSSGVRYLLGRRRLDWVVLAQGLKAPLLAMLSGMALVYGVGEARWLAFVLGWWCQMVFGMCRLTLRETCR